MKYPHIPQKEKKKKRRLRTSNEANITSKTCKRQKGMLLEQIGSDLEKLTEEKWVYENDEMVFRSISYVPVLYNIFERIFVNTADSVRIFPSMDYLRVNIDPVKNTVSVYNTGRGLPADTHRKEKVVEATMLTEKDFCTKFVIEISDGLRLTKFKQVFTNNMRGKSRPKVTKYKAEDREDWTKLTFKPNLKKFKMAHLEDDVVGLMKKRVLDMAESLGKTVNVELNDRLIRVVESFDDYDALCMKSSEKFRPLNAIELALSEEKAICRNTWNRYFEHGEELILFSSPADPKKSIPSVFDGLKPDQRKVLFCAFERKLYENTHVGEFIGYMSRHFLSACYDSEKALGCTIIEMAQDFVGSNNINLLKPNGQFGTRDFGGKDHGSARWNYTELNPLTRFLFHEDDDKLLDHLNEDGTRSIEPNWYIPIIPLVLVNGSGIGVGWTSIPCYDPLKIIDNVKRWLKCEHMVPMDPSYRRFKGTIQNTANKGEYRVSGLMEEIDGQPNSFKITELPIGMWTEDYTDFLRSISDRSPYVKDPLIEDFSHDVKDYENVYIEVKIKPDKINSLRKLSPEELCEKFKLISTVSTNNMHLFDAEGKIKKFDSPEQILKEFCELRLPYYDKRKEKILDNLRKRIVRLENRSRFIRAVLKRDINMINRQKDELISELEKKGFVCIVEFGGYDYLIYLHLWFFTKQNAKKLVAKKVEKMVEFFVLNEKHNAEMWEMDLDELKKKIEEINRIEAEEERKKSSQAGKTAKTQNVVPENDNTSMVVPMDVVPMDVVEVAKPEGRAGSSKDDIANLVRCLDTYINLSSSSGITGALASEFAATKKRIKEMLKEMKTGALGLAKHFFSNLSESSESETEEVVIIVNDSEGKYVFSDDVSESDESESGPIDDNAAGSDSDDNAALHDSDSDYYKFPDSDSDSDDSAADSDDNAALLHRYPSDFELD